VAIVAHDRRGAELAKRLASVLQAPGFRIRRRHLPPGILVDSVALARVGARAVTVARLDWGTLKRIHTTSDEANGLVFTTARYVGMVLAKLG
jgi:hypothetical protein